MGRSKEEGERRGGREEGGIREVEEGEGRRRREKGASFMFVVSVATFMKMCFIPQVYSLYIFCIGGAPLLCV